MRSRSWFVLILGFGTLLALTTLLGFGAVHRSRAIYNEMAASQETYLKTEQALRGVPADLYLAGLMVRDYLLDPSLLRAPYYQQELRDIRESLQKQLDVLEAQPASEQTPIVRRLRAGLDDFWKMLDPIFAWTPNQKAALSYIFLRQYVFPRTAEVVVLSREISAAQTANILEERGRLDASQKRLDTLLRQMTVVVLALGFVVAGLSIYRVTVLERRGERQKDQIEEAEAELRQLSRNLVQAQEQERNALSRELHDQADQLLTGMGMDLSNLESDLTDLESGKASSVRPMRDQLAHTQQLNAETLRWVRNLAMGLRPSMLDDLALGPALDWQARDFSRRSRGPGTLPVAGEHRGTAEAR